MHAHDVAAVLAAERRIAPFPWTEGNFADSLRAGHSAWVCREGDILVGHAVMMNVLDEAHLLNIGILPERRRHGLGSELLEHLFEVARGQGIQRMLLEVRLSNESGRAFYRRFGFGEIGRRREYYPARNGREDAIVMACDL